MKFYKTLLLTKLCVLLSACSSFTNSFKTSDLEYTWDLVEIEGVRPDVNDFPIKIPYLNFKLENKLNGSDGCNGFTADYEITNQKLVMKNVISSKMYCNDAKDRDFSRLLSKASCFKIVNDTLVFIYDDKEVLIFKKRV